MFKRWLSGFVILVGGLNVLLTVAFLLGRFHWALDVFTHFTLQITFFLALAFVAGILLRISWRWLLVGGVALLVNLVIVFPYFLPIGRTLPVNDDVLRVAALNVSTRSDHYARITDYMLAFDVDVMVLVEVRQDLLDHLDTVMSEAYPYVYAVPSRRTLGSAVVSRIPFTSAETRLLGSEHRRALEVSFEWAGESVRLLTAHPYPPLGNSWANSRNQELALFAEIARKIDEPLLIVGDFNAAPWSYPVRQLTAQADLSPVMLGYGIRSTWFWGFGLLQAPLDYMLTSPEWVTLGYRTGAPIGSDHLPILADFQLRSADR